MCARVQLTRFRPARRRAGGVRFTRLRRKARHHLFSAISLPKALLPPDSIVLHVMQRNCWHLENNQPDLWSEVGWLRKSLNLFAQRSTQRQGDKRQRRSRRNRVTRTVAKWFAQSTSEWPKTLPQGIQGDRNPLGTPFSSIFRRAAKDGATGGRRPPSAARKNVKQKDHAPGGPTEKTMPVKTRNKTITPPGGPTEKRMHINT